MWHLLIAVMALACGDSSGCRKPTEPCVSLGSLVGPVSLILIDPEAGAVRVDLTWLLAAQREKGHVMQMESCYPRSPSSP